MLDLLRSAEVNDKQKPTVSPETHKSTIMQQKSIILKSLGTNKEAELRQRNDESMELKLVDFLINSYTCTSMCPHDSIHNHIIEKKPP